MARAVKSGGQVLIWVYGREGNRWLVALLDPLRRAVQPPVVIGSSAFYCSGLPQAFALSV
jgi:hypothetical protein